MAAFFQYICSINTKGSLKNKAEPFIKLCFVMHIPLGRMKSALLGTPTLSGVF